jgi:hypothetical protein
MDIRTIDENYEQLRRQSQDTVQAIQNLAQKLQATANDGDQRAREWLLDLKEITIGFRAEQHQVTNLLQAIHLYVENQPQQVHQQQPYPQPQYQQPQYQHPPVSQQPPVYQRGGFFGSTFGQAIATGAGFAIGEDIIDDIFF